MKVFSLYHELYDDFGCLFVVSELLMFESAIHVLVCMFCTSKIQVLNHIYSTSVTIGFRSLTLEKNNS